jgi:hypothetical protein
LGPISLVRVHRQGSKHFVQWPARSLASVFEILVRKHNQAVFDIDLSFCVSKTRATGGVCLHFMLLGRARFCSRAFVMQSELRSVVIYEGTKSV